VQDERGASDFEPIRSAMRSRPQRLMLYAFDLLALDCEDIRNGPRAGKRRGIETWDCCCALAILIIRSDPGAFFDCT
jgi:ATP-dependent DNA ligase